MADAGIGLCSDATPYVVCEMDKQLIINDCTKTLSVFMKDHYEHTASLSYVVYLGSHTRGGRGARGAWGAGGARGGKLS